MIILILFVILYILPLIITLYVHESSLRKWHRLTENLYNDRERKDPALIWVARLCSFLPVINILLLMCVIDEIYDSYVISKSDNKGQ